MSVKTALREQIKLEFLDEVYFENCKCILNARQFICQGLGVNFKMAKLSVGHVISAWDSQIIIPMLLATYECRIQS